MVIVTGNGISDLSSNLDVAVGVTLFINALWEKYKFVFSLPSYVAQSAGALEYTDYISAER